VDPQPRPHDEDLDAHLNEAARREVLRQDGRRKLGENLERAAELIKAAFELRDSFTGARR
jgi:propanediol dehydratase small subunit